VANPEVNDTSKSQRNPYADEVRGMDAPNGLDLHPQPRKVVRISRRASMAIIFVIVGLLLAFAYGGYRRTQRAQVAARDAGLPKNVSPATQASAEFTKSIPDGTAPLACNRPLPPVMTRTSLRAVQTRKPGSHTASIHRRVSPATDCHRSEWWFDRPQLRKHRNPCPS